jgi:hypothetical protein
LSHEIWVEQDANVKETRLRAETESQALHMLIGRTLIKMKRTEQNRIVLRRKSRGENGIRVAVNYKRAVL